LELFFLLLYIRNQASAPCKASCSVTWFFQIRWNSLCQWRWDFGWG